MRKATLSALILSVLSATAAWAISSFPTVGYEATYYRKTAQGDSTYKVITDGKGLMRIETEPPTSGIQLPDQRPARSITILDYKKRLSYILLEKQKLALKQALPASASGAMLNDETIKELGGKALGAQTKFGHPCHGWQYKVGKVTTESWTADDLQCPIHTFSTSESGDELTHLKEYKLRDDFDPDEFAVPADYKLSSGGPLGE